ncbi:unnamed protein product [Schistosoma margrebowiei]|uniref:Uncharacterized protein n=1 Tax=Schistosoma margrebowiei TaxID=48269 RepID=A0A183N3I0_9TREM|nr:unnamed protein product [Schistosoma margrebowiei]
MSLRLTCRIPRFRDVARHISSSPVLSKQPFHDKLRSKRSNPPPHHSLPFYDEAPPDSFPSKQMDIVGQWGSTDSNIKRLRIQERKNKKAALNNSRTKAKQFKAQAEHTEANKRVKRKVGADERKYIKNLATPTEKATRAENMIQRQN